MGALVGLGVGGAGAQMLAPALTPQEMGSTMTESMETQEHNTTDDERKLRRRHSRMCDKRFACPKEGERNLTPSTAAAGASRHQVHHKPR